MVSSSTENEGVGYYWEKLNVINNRNFDNDCGNPRSGRGGRNEKQDGNLITPFGGARRHQS